MSERARDDCCIGGERGSRRGEGGEGERRETLTKEHRRRWSRSISKVERGKGSGGGRGEGEER